MNHSSNKLRAKTHFSDPKWQAKSLLTKFFDNYQNNAGTDLTILKYYQEAIKTFANAITDQNSMRCN